MSFASHVSLAVTRRAVGHVRLRVLRLGARENAAERGVELLLVRRQVERPGDPWRVRRPADDGAAEDRVDAVAVGERICAEEPVLVPVEAEVAAERHRGHQLMCGRLRVRADGVGHGCADLQLPGGPRRIGRRVRRAPWPVGDCGQAVREGTDDLPHRADAPPNELPPAVLEVEAVELPLVGDVRVRPNDLANVRVPDVVRGCALDGRPADEAGLRRQRHRRRLPADVEPEGLAPGGRAACRDRAHVGVERVRLAREPREDEVHRRRRDPDRRDPCLDDGALRPPRCPTSGQRTPER